MTTFCSSANPLKVPMAFHLVLAGRTSVKKSILLWRTTMVSISGSEYFFLFWVSPLSMSVLLILFRRLMASPNSFFLVFFVGSLGSSSHVLFWSAPLQ